MLTTILRYLTRTILKKVAEGFNELTRALGDLNNKITVVENEYVQKFERFDKLEATLDSLNAEFFSDLTATELQTKIDEIVNAEADAILK
jgi:predicted nuclease with TOPRIM domain